MPSVLFVCFDNYLRSVIAEIVASRRWRGRAMAMSAGVSRFSRSHSPAHELIPELFNLSAVPHTRHISEIAGPIDWFVAMDPHIAVHLQDAITVHPSRLVTWDLQDPEKDSIRLFRELVRNAEHLIIRLERERLRLRF